MNLTDSERIKLLFGYPLFFKDVCLVYSPLLKEIAEIGMETFFEYYQLLTMSKPIIEDKSLEEVISKLSDLDFLIKTSFLDQKQFLKLQQAFHFFTHEKVMFLQNPSRIIVGDLNEHRVIDEDNFYEFQYYIKAVCSLTSDEQDIRFSDQDDKNVAALKKKLLEARKKRENLKKKNKKTKDNDKNENDPNFSDLIASLPLGTNGAYNLNTIQNLTYYAFLDQIKRMGWFEEFNMNSRAALAGAKISKSKLTHWIKNLSNV